MIRWLEFFRTFLIVFRRIGRLISWFRGWVLSGSSWCCFWVCYRRIFIVVRLIIFITCSRRWWRFSFVGGSGTGSRLFFGVCIGFFKSWRWIFSCFGICWNDGVFVDLLGCGFSSSVCRILFFIGVGSFGGGEFAFFFLMIFKWKEKIGFLFDIIWKIIFFSRFFILVW